MHTYPIAFLCCLLAAALPAGEEPPIQLHGVRIQPDQAPDCTSLTSIAASVTRGCTSNDAKAIAIYNFMQLSHYHHAYPQEPGGVPALKVITNYGWSLCGGLHSTQSALWRTLGWEWRFVGWDGHTTVEAKYDDRWHYLDVFTKFYAWMPDGRGGMTIAGEDELTAKPQELIESAMTLDKGRAVVYQNSNPFAVFADKANWRAPAFLRCGDGIKSTIGGLQTHKVTGSPEGWAGINHADGTYSTDVVLAPGMALTSTWDALPDAWYWEGHTSPPAHTCGGHKDTRNDPGIGLVLEPYINAKSARSYGNGMVTFAPDFAGKAMLRGFLSAENVVHADKALMPADKARPAVVVFQLASPYVMTRAGGTVDGGARVEVSTDQGRSWMAVEAKDFTAAVKGRLAAQVRLTFSEKLTALRFESIVQNNPGSLPYLSPGRNVVTVSAADAKALGDATLVVTYAYRLGSRSKSFEQLCEEGKEIAKQHNATWSETVTYVRKRFTAKDLPATFVVDCPTPKGRHPVYPRMMLLRREVVAPGAAASPLPAGAVEAVAAAEAELPSFPSPFLVGSEAPPVIKARPTKTIELPLEYLQYCDEKGVVAERGQLRWPKDPKENGKVLAAVTLIQGDLKSLLAMDVAAARLCVPVLSGHPSTACQIGVAFLTAPPVKGAPVDFTALAEAQGAGLVPKQPSDAPGFAPAKVVPIDITRQIRAIARKQAVFNGMGIRIVPNRTVDDGYTVRCEVSPSDRIILQVDVYAE